MADIKVYGKLVNDTPEAIIADAAQIGAGSGRTQAQINAELASGIASETQAREDAIQVEAADRDTADRALDGRITTEVSARQAAIEAEQNARAADVQTLNESITQLEAKQVMAITLDQNTGILSLHYDNNSNVTNATLGTDGKLKITYEI